MFKHQIKKNYLKRSEKNIFSNMKSNIWQISATESKAAGDTSQGQPIALSTTREPLHLYAGAKST